MIPRVLVIGATGAQGGGVARHLLRRGRFAVRAFTSRPQSPAAIALKESGAEVIEGDLANRAGLRTALKGCYGVFAVTSCWGQHEDDVHGANLINAVAGSEVEHLVLSTGPGGSDTRDSCAERRRVIRMRLDAYARSLQLPATYVRPALDFESVVAWLRTTLGADGSIVVSIPGADRPLPGIAVEDIGGVIASLLEQPGESVDRCLSAIGDLRPLGAYAEAWARQVGRPIRCDDSVTTGCGDPAVEDFMQSVEFASIPDVREEDLAASRMLHPDIQVFDAWLNRHRVDLERTLAELSARDEEAADQPHRRQGLSPR